MLLHIDKKLKQLRAEKGLRQKDVAEGIGISTNLLKKYETGRAEPPLLNLIKLSEFFCVPVTHFLPSTSIIHNQV